MPEPPSTPIEFPDKGIDVTREFAEQPPRTTADAVNVASKESIAGRRRGGSRTGFSKYIAEQFPQGSVQFQHLEIIVDPTVDALPQNFETPGDDWVEHPRFPDILIPPDGAPWQPNPNTSNFTGTGEVVGVGSIIGEGGNDDPVTATAWTATITYQAGFSDLEINPGTETIVLCDGQPAELLDWNGHDISFNDIADSTAFHAWLVAEALVGGGTTPGDVIASYTLNDMGPC